MPTDFTNASKDCLVKIAEKALNWIAYRDARRLFPGLHAEREETLELELHAALVAAREDGKDKEALDAIFDVEAGEQGKDPTKTNTGGE